MGANDFERDQRAIVDIGIICMIPDVELNALHHVLTAAGARQTNNDLAFKGWEYFAWGNARGVRLRLVVACCDAQSNLEAALTTQIVLARHEPRYVFLCGIAGGMQLAKYKLGDVVIGADVIYRRFTKIREDGSFGAESSNVPPSEGGAALEKRLFGRHPDTKKIQSLYTEDRALFAVHGETILSWDLVLDHAATKETLLRHVDRQFAVVETEGAGFLKAVAAHATIQLSRPWRRFRIGGTDALVVRGISDPAADKAATDAGPTNWRRVAARNAAQTVLLILDLLDDDDFKAPAAVGA